MYTWHPPRAVSAGSSVTIVAVIFGLLVLGLNVHRTAESAFRLISVNLTEPPPSPPNERPEAPRQHAQKPAPRHEASPRNVRNQAAEVVVPPVPPLVPPPPITTVPEAGTGAAANNGAARLPGPGQGAGGNGNGLGGGGTGGDGDGDGEAVVGPHQTGGKMSYGDLPPGILSPGQEASVDVVYAVNPDGRASDCRAEHSSGYPTLDSLACRLIEQRFRFRPARDQYGRPVRAWVGENHTWVAREN